MDAPKLFVSYSWSNPTHEERVLQLATDLRDYGIDVILDKWDLKEGHDAHAFMERIVTDPEVKKVILVCDQMYVEKTDGRTGGVGKEAQIITGEIYERQAQDKFVAVVVERNAEGQCCLPAYYRSRIYIDLSDPSRHAQNFEQLVRWVYDKPLHTKPELGKAPAFLTVGDNDIVLATSSRFKRALDAVRNGRDYAAAAAAEYLGALSEEFEKLRIPSDSDPYDEAVVQSVSAFIPYRDEAIELFIAIAMYRDTQELRMQIHRFFERLLGYLDRPRRATSGHDWDCDNFRFVIHELFLYAVATFLRFERYEAASSLTGTEFYFPGQSDYGRDDMVGFEVFRKPMGSLMARNKRLGLRRISVRADMLKERCKGTSIQLSHLMQADFTLFIRNGVHHQAYAPHWWPETLVYVGRHSGAFEIFARSRSTVYFERVKAVLGIQSKEELKPVLDAYASGQTRLPMWDFDSFSPEHLLGFKEIATKP